MECRRMRWQGGKLRSQGESPREGTMEGAQAAILEAGFWPCCHLSSCDLTIGFFCARNRELKHIVTKHGSLRRLQEATGNLMLRVSSSSQNPRKG